MTVADWLAGWPGKPDYVVLEAVLGPLPKWPIKVFEMRLGMKLFVG